MLSIYLYSEWKGKPAAMVTYRIWGTGKTPRPTLLAVRRTIGLQLAETRPQLYFGGQEPGARQCDEPGGKLGQATKESWAKDKDEDVLSKRSRRSNTMLLAASGQPVA